MWKKGFHNKLMITNITAALLNKVITIINVKQGENMTDIPVGFQKKRKLKNGFQIKSWKQLSDQKNQKVYGVFNGGGAKGAAFSGAVEVFDQKYDWAGVAGTSAGAITAVLVAAGYNGATLKEIVKEMDLVSLLDIPDLANVQEGTTRWLNEPNMDLITNLLVSTDSRMFFDEKEQKLMNKYNNAFKLLEGPEKGVLPIDSHSGSSFFTGRFIAKLVDILPDQIFLNTRSREDLSKNLHIIIFHKWNELSLSSPTSDDIRVALRKVIQVFLKNRVPDFIMDKIEREDTEKLLPMFLSLYYFGGAFSGKAFTIVMEHYLQLAVREEIDLSVPVTFKELSFDLRGVASDLSSKRLLSFPNDLLDYGFQDEDETLDTYYLNFSVAEAVLASMSIPFVFQTFILENPETNKKHQLVDGGMLSNFPISEFADNESNIPICGFKLGSSIVESKVSQRVLPYIESTISTMMDATDKLFLKFLGDKIIVTDIPLSMTDGEHSSRKINKELLKTVLGDLDKLEAFKDKLEEKSKQLPEDSLDLVFLKKHIKSVVDPIEELKFKRNELRNSIKKTTRNCDTLDFDLTIDQKQDLHNNGKAAAEASLSRVEEMLKKREK